ncbi:hypothetical protein RIF29_33135 [Crotalaria pallida]|uniref:Uncharacterized protein n=1 Tax=Crotalaria pallida TaxID=3830 RepID=A0AAN9EDC4_CROPI
MFEETDVVGEVCYKTFPTGKWSQNGQQRIYQGPVLITKKHPNPSVYPCVQYKHLSFTITLPDGFELPSFSTTTNTPPSMRHEPSLTSSEVNKEEDITAVAKEDEDPCEGLNVAGPSHR